MSIWLIDDKASVELNGRQVVDSIVMENFEDRSQPLYPEGPIELQKHSGPLSFRNIRVRELFLPLGRNTEGNSSTNQDKMPSLHMLPELVAESTASIAISSDGKTVFWDRNGVIWSAERDDLNAGSTFRNAQEWIEGRHLTISGDVGVLLIKQPNRDSETLHQFTLTDSKPSRPSEISTLVPDSGRVFSPHLSSNGDVLIFAGRITGQLPDPCLSCSFPSVRQVACGRSLCRYFGIHNSPTVGPGPGCWMMARCCWPRIKARWFVMTSHGIRTTSSSPDEHR